MILSCAFCTAAGCQVSAAVWACLQVSLNFHEYAKNLENSPVGMSQRVHQQNEQQGGTRKYRKIGIKSTAVLYLCC